jgi:hypothetical protein
VAAVPRFSRANTSRADADDAELAILGRERSIAVNQCRPGLALQAKREAPFDHLAVRRYDLEQRVGIRLVEREFLVAIARIAGG